MLQINNSGMTLDERMGGKMENKSKEREKESQNRIDKNRREGEKQNQIDRNRRKGLEE